MAGTAAVERQSQAAQDRDQEARLSKLDALGLVLAERRAEAIEGRRACGIEDEWREDEENYHGPDQVMRRRDKPYGQLPLEDEPERTKGSQAYINITKPYCQAAAARAADMLQPSDEKAWHLGPTPIPDLVPLSEGHLQRKLARQVEQAHPDDPKKQEQVRKELVEFAQKTVEKAREKARRAEDQINDWHIECQYSSHVRRMMEDVTMLGTGVIKGPISRIEKTIAYVKGQIVIKEEVKPVSERRDPWNIYPDPFCGEDIQHGSYIFERDPISRREILGLLEEPEDEGWIHGQIKDAIREGPTRATGRWVVEDNEPSFFTGLERERRDNIFELWYYYGLVDAEDMHAAGCECDDEFEHIHAEIIMLNNRVIKANLNELDTGEFPYDFMPWEKRKGIPWGSGVATDLREPQRIVTNTTQAMLDNAGKAAGPQVIQSDRLVPADGERSIVPWKIWFLNEDEELEHMDKAMYFVDVPMYQTELMNIIEFALRMAEDVTGMPMIMQGQTNQRTPDTLGGMQLQNENASTVLRRIARNFDDYVTERHIRRYYRYLLAYADDDSMKGDFTIDARGSTFLVERELQAQALLQMGDMVMNPVFKKDPAKWADQVFRSRRLNPKDFDYESDEWQQIVEKLAQEPQDMTLQVAQIKAQADQMRTEMQESTKKFIAQLKEQGENQRQAAAQDFELYLNTLEQDLEAFNAATDKEKWFSELKGRLAETRMKINAQLQVKDKEIANPPTEPPGRARDGHSYEE